MLDPFGVLKKFITICYQDLTLSGSFQKTQDHQTGSLTVLFCNAVAFVPAANTLLLFLYRLPIT